MEEQNYRNHVRFYPPHHFVFYPLVFIVSSISLYFAVSTEQRHRLLWVGITITFFIVAWLAYMLRQHYALTLQNRLILLELRFRYYVLTQQRLEPLESKLSFGQLAALRFSSDEELALLVRRAIEEKLSPKEIKKAIRQWHPDHMRV